MTKDLKLKVYLDLDGVFADFDKRVQAITGKHPDDLHRARLWQAINADKTFFSQLELIEGAMALWHACKDLDVEFLTGAPSAKVFHAQKREWVKRIFGPEFTCHVVPRRLKRDYAGPNKILVDDTEDNIRAWEEAGGIGILHRGDHASTIAALQEVLRLYEEKAA